MVLPAYRAALTLKQTYGEIPFDLVDDVVLVDDRSPDNTVEVARQLGIRHVVVHEVNKGYGGNQKTCYDTAKSLGADIVVMLHPDYQYTPKLLASMIALIGSGVYPVVFGSRILGKGALKGGMPLYKYVANRFLTFIQNVLCGQKLSEYHTGYRAFDRKVLDACPYHLCSDDFVFDNQMLVQCMAFGFGIAEVTCPTRYTADSSSIGFRRSCVYGLGVLKATFQYRLWKWGLLKPRFLAPDGRKIEARAP